MSSTNPDYALPPDRKRIGILARFSTPVFFILCLLVAGLTGPTMGLVAMFVAALVLDAAGVPASSSSAGAILALSGLLFTPIGFVLATVALRRKRRRDLAKNDFQSEWEKSGRDPVISSGGSDTPAQGVGGAAPREGAGVDGRGGAPYGKYAPPAGPKTRIFISYSRKDMAFVDRLETALRARGFEPLIDRSEIYAFEDWWQRIEKLIGRADTIVFVLSPDAAKSDVALKEVAHAASLNKRFAPIVCRPVDDAAVPEALRRLNFIFFNDPARFEASTDQLAEALQVDIRWIRQHTEYGEAARRWAVADRPGGLLLRPPALDEAEYLIAYRPHGAPPPTGEMQLFFAESRKAETLAQIHRRRTQIFSYVMLVAIIVGLISWINQSYLYAQINWYWTLRPYAAANFWPYVLKPLVERTLTPDSNKSFRECAPKRQGADFCPDMIVIPAGSFLMGSSATEAGSNTIEEPQHMVTIAKPFAVAKYDVTFANWKACVAVGSCQPITDADARFSDDQQPVINVAWEDAQQYAAWLARMTGKPYRLLSEAEWEYAERAGTNTVYYWGNDIELNGTVMANCKTCGSRWDGKDTSPVGSFKPNAFGLYDMAGDVMQWVQDCIHANYIGAPSDGSAWTMNAGSSTQLKERLCNYRAVRTGSWADDPLFLRSAHRGFLTEIFRSVNIGFRVARTLGP